MPVCTRTRVPGRIMRKEELERGPGERLSTVKSENPGSLELETVANNVWVGLG